MLESKLDQPNEPQAPKKRPADAHDSNLLDDNIESEIYERNRNWYIPSEPLGFKYFEKTWYLMKYKDTAVHVHITLPTYIICTLIYSMFHVEALSWFTLILLLLIFHMIALALQISVCLHIAKQFEAHIHRILIWPYGFIGYAADYKQWTHFLIVEYAAPLVHIMIFVLFWGLARILNVSDWRYLSPMHLYFGQNLLNGIWVCNIIIASLHLCIPVYSMKTARFMVNYLYRKRTHRDVAQILLLPTAFMSLILFVFGIVDARPLPLFLAVWSMYQAYLIYDGNRRNLIAKLPLFQSLEDSLRHKKKRDRKVRDKQEIQTQNMIVLNKEKEYVPNVSPPNKDIEVDHVDETDDKGNLAQVVEEEHVDNIVDQEYELVQVESKGAAESNSSLSNPIGGDFVDVIND